jgi:hypothetical protein
MRCWREREFTDGGKFIFRGIDKSCIVLIKKLLAVNAGDRFVIGETSKCLPDIGLKKSEVT